MALFERAIAQCDAAAGDVQTIDNGRGFGTRDCAGRTRLRRCYPRGKGCRRDRTCGFDLLGTRHLRARRRYGHPRSGETRDQGKEGQQKRIGGVDRGSDALRPWAKTRRMARAAPRWICPGNALRPSVWQRSSSRMSKGSRDISARYFRAWNEYGAPDGIRTHGPQIRNLMLYPAELRAHAVALGGAARAGNPSECRQP